MRHIHGQVPARRDVLGRGANAKIHGGALLVGFPEAVFFERLRNPDELDRAGDAFASRKLHEERSRVRGCLRQLERSGLARLRRARRQQPVSASHERSLGLIIAKRASVVIDSIVPRIYLVLPSSGRNTRDSENSPTEPLAPDLCTDRRPPARKDRLRPRRSSGTTNGTSRSAVTQRPGDPRRATFRRTDTTAPNRFRT